MKISELIKELEARQAELGDVEVYVWGQDEYQYPVEGADLITQPSLCTGEIAEAGVIIG